ncbi:MAG: hypothetical protein ACHQ0J_09805 [Candidatus Dormibacterales bacterium]
MTFLARITGLVTAKAAIGLVTGVLAVSAAGMAGEATITGSINPVNWGQQVQQQVEQCKAALAPGMHGIGSCVSSFARQHGALVSAEHRASSARENGPTNKANGNGNGKGNGKGNGGANGQGLENGNGNGSKGNGNGNGHGHSGS